MSSSHMKPFVDIISSVCESVCGYGEYLEVQRGRVSINHENEDRDDSSSLDDFSVRKIKQINDSNLSFLSKLKDRLLKRDVYVPVNVNENVVVPRRQAICTIS